MNGACVARSKKRDGKDFKDFSSLVFLLSLFLSPLMILAAPPPDLFVDRAKEWGLVFTYASGRTGEFYFPEIMGGGVALFDYDNDGDLDVFVVQGHSLSPSAGKLGTESWGRLFRNDLITPQGRNPTPRFVDVTEA